MKKVIVASFLVLFGCTIAAAQAARFPGLSPFHVEVLDGAKQVTPIPLPTWVPDGFRVEKVNAKLGGMVPIDEKVLTIIYSRKLADGRWQRFAIDAGFDGLGGLPYDVTNELATPVGRIDLMYEPKDLDNERAKLKNFAMTEWFKVGRTDFHYDGMYGAKEGDDPNAAMIPLADTLKILRSLKRY